MRDSASHAICLEKVSKVYRLYPSPLMMAVDLLGFSWLKRKAFDKLPKHAALSGINLNIKMGERVGIIGRNGAGKTTLLKLVTGNFAPSDGRVSVGGRVQSLMDAGLGFHPEFTGLENVRSSLIYNGLSESEMKAAIEDILEFAELGDFINYPIKTYSQGMAARLAFATATAIKPEILIVDEVLGAGDAYFSTKSARRMKALTGEGMTLLLVSHSNQQILEFCERAIWLEGGKVVMDGPALDVVKAYDRFIRSLDEDRIKATNQKRALRDLASLALESATNGSVSRWKSDVGGLKIRNFRLLDSQQKESYVFDNGAEINFEISMQSEAGGTFSCRAVILVFTLDGRAVSLHCSEPEELSIIPGGTEVLRLRYAKNILGHGEYLISVALYRTLDLDDMGRAESYDLLDRSFQFKVVGRFKGDSSLFHHPAQWLKD